MIAEIKRLSEFKNWGLLALGSLVPTWFIWHKIYKETQTKKKKGLIWELGVPKQTFFFLVNEIIRFKPRDTRYCLFNKQGLESMGAWKIRKRRV